MTVFKYQQFISLLLINKKNLNNKMKSLANYFKRLSTSSLRATEIDIPSQASHTISNKTAISDTINISNETDPALTYIKEFNNSLRPLRPEIKSSSQ